jgi:hypothetical protein
MEVSFWKPNPSADLVTLGIGTSFSNSRELIIKDLIAHSDMFPGLFFTKKGQ